MESTTSLLQQRYEIVRPLAQGETGAIYETRDWIAGGEPVALKLCVFETDEKRELGWHAAQTLAQLSHPSLPRVRDLFIEGAGHYVVMDFVEGDDLDEMLRTYGGPFDFRTVLAWADQLLDALHYLHTLEPPIIHRDIKPANIKLSPQGRAMLLDFGVAKDAPDTAELYPAISPYVPIEQLQRNAIDARFDLYALGATLFQLLTGALPENPLMRLEHVAGGQADPQRLASEFVAEIPRTVAQVIQRALALDREARFQTAQEMRAALQLALKTAPSLSQPLPPAPYHVEATPKNTGRLTQNAQTATPPEKPLPPPPSLRSQPPLRPQPVVQTVNVRPSSETVQATATTTVPVPHANLAKPSLNWHFTAMLVVLLFGGTGMGVLARFFLGKSSAEPPVKPTAARIAAATQNADGPWPAQFTNRFGVSFRLLPAGRFTMGSAHEADAQPQHIVTIPRPFYMGVYEITQQQWRSLMHSTPSASKGDRLPVENVTWFDAQKYIAQLNLMRDGYSYRLPTEAEWEYAARAGQAGETADELTRLAWFAANASAPQPVGQKEANAFGLHDMLGNVAEWCADSYHESYVGAPVNGEAWMAATGLKLFRVIRGESWQGEAQKVHSGYRGYNEPHFHSVAIGFRLVAEPLGGE